MILRFVTRQAILSGFFVMHQRRIVFLTKASQSQETISSTAVIQLLENYQFNLLLLRVIQSTFRSFANGNLHGLCGMRGGV